MDSSWMKYLPAQPRSPKKNPVVGGEHDYGITPQAALVKPGQDSPNLHVDASNEPVVAPHGSLPSLRCREAALLTDAALVSVLEETGQVLEIARIEFLERGYLDILVQLVIFGIVDEERRDPVLDVRSLEAHRKAERRLSVTSL